MSNFNFLLDPEGVVRLVDGIRTSGARSRHGILHQSRFKVVARKQTRNAHLHLEELLRLEEQQKQDPQDTFRQLLERAYKRGWDSLSERSAKPYIAPWAFLVAPGKPPSILFVQYREDARTDAAVYEWTYYLQFGDDYDEQCQLSLVEDLRTREREWSLTSLLLASAFQHGLVARLAVGRAVA